MAPLSMLTIIYFFLFFLFILEETYQRSQLTLLSSEKATSECNQMFFWVRAIGYRSLTREI